MTDLEINILKSEILLKIQVTAKKVEKLSFETFPTMGPQNILLLSARILEQLVKRFGEEVYSLDQMILIKTGIVRQIIELVSYIEYSTIKNVTWSIIPAYNRLFKSLRNDIEYIIVPQWNENYGIHTRNLIDEFRHQLIKTPGLVFEVGVSEETVNKLFEGITSEIYLIKYSRLEKLSALHLALLGHEIGHIFATKWINAHYLDFAKRTKLSDRLEEIVLGELAKEQLSNDMFIELLKSKRIEEYNRKITDVYRELLSDIFGCALFGHTYVVALYLFASITSDLDKSNWQNGYLSWRFRLQNCILFLSFVLKKDPNKLEHYALYESICSSIHGNIIDLGVHDVCNLLIGSFRNEEEKIFAAMCEYTGTQLFTKRISNKQIDAACYRLENEIIPNAIVEDEVEMPIDFRSILYAIWLVSYKKDHKDIQLFSKRIQFYNLLGIKGIELSVEQEEYNDFIKRKTIREA